MILLASNRLREPLSVIGAMLHGRAKVLHKWRSGTPCCSRLGELEGGGTSKGGTVGFHSCKDIHPSARGLRMQPGKYTQYVHSWLRSTIYSPYLVIKIIHQYKEGVDNLHYLLVLFHIWEN